MVSMIKEYESELGLVNCEDDSLVAKHNLLERKTTKTPSRTTAFHTKKSALFEAVRKDADAILRDGIAHV